MKRVLLVALAFALASCGSANAGPGPLTPTNVHGWGKDYPVGQVFTDGWEVLNLHGHQNAVIDSVRQVRGPNGDGLKMLGLLLADPSRQEGSVGPVASWPPRHFPHFTESAIVSTKTITPAKMGWELLIGYKVTKPGYLVRRGIVVNYHIGDQHYRYYDPAWMAICSAPKYVRTHTCPAPNPHNGKPGY